MSAQGPMQPLAIVGIGCLFPGARGPAAYWSRVLGKADAVTDVPATHWRAEDYYHPDPKAPDRVYARRGAFLEPVAFPPAEFGVAPTNLEAIDTAQLLGLVVAREALEDAGYQPEPAATAQATGAPLRPLDRSRVSVILGVTGTLELVIPLGARLGHPLWRRALRDAGVSDAVAEDVVSRIADGYVNWQENSFPGLLGNVVAGRIANRYDLGGTNCVVDAACASSLAAVHLAALELTSGRADVVLTGGVDTFNDVFMFSCFSKTPALSPTGSARPFDESADGTVLGEGLGMVVLKRLDDACRDGDRIYAVLKGLGTASDGRGNAVYAPRQTGQVKALRAAYGAAGVGPETVGLVEAHGTGTKLGDATELAALAEVYSATGRQGTWCALGSVKSQIGHTKAAAGAAGLIKAALALYHRALPPTINVTRPLEPLRDGRSPFYASTDPRPWMRPADHPRRAAVSAFGFGGSNFHAVLEEHLAASRAIHWDGDVQVLAFSAGSIEGLTKQLDAVPADAAWPALRALAAQSRKSWDSTLPCRLVLVVERNITDMRRLLHQAREFLVRPSGQSGPVPQGAYLGTNAVPGALAALFPGQGSQYVGMGRDLACRFPGYQDVLEEAQAAIHRAGAGNVLADRLYPLPTLAAAEQSANEDALRRTEIAQPALAVTCWGLWQVLAYFGVRPDFAAGHSFGELVALAVAGRLKPQELFELAVQRGRLMSAAGGEQPGGMLAVATSAAQARQVLREEQLDLELANDNGPEQVVLSGTLDMIGRAEIAFTSRKQSAKRLEVGGAFHSSLVREAASPFRQLLDRAAFLSGTIPVYSNTTAGPYPSEAIEVRDRLAQQLALPVRWREQVEALHDAGARTFLEVGPGAKLTRLVGSVLRGREAHPVAVDASSGRKSGVHDLACCLASLAARGHPVRLDLWDAGAPETPESQSSTFVVPLCGANYVRPRPARPSAPPPAAPVAPASQLERSLTPQPPMNGHSERVSGRATQASPPAESQSGLATALQVTRESLAALQQMQERTAQVHRQFLEGQEAAQRTVGVLVEQQQRLLEASLGGPSPAVASTPVLPVKVVPAPVTATNGQASSPPKPAASAGQASVDGVLLEVVAEKTGYPQEMLGLDMALDADLGIDSIKRVEILSALQERLPQAPTVRPEQLGALHTLRQVADFLTGVPEHAPIVPHGAEAPITESTIAGTASMSTVLLEVVAEKTGYPQEMLGLDMALDADLGIDSIKRVEILSALQERLPQAPAVRPDQLGAIHTLRQVADFLDGVLPAEPPPVREATAPAPQDVCSLPDATLERSVLEVVPLENAQARERISLAAGAVVWVSSDDPPLSQALARRLEAQGLVAVLAPCAELAQRRAPEGLGGLVLLAPPSGGGDGFARDALAVLRNAGAAFNEQGRRDKSVLVTVARMDGAFGLSGAAIDHEPTDGGLAGLAKTAAREWPRVNCKALDLAPSFGPVEEAAAAVVDEMLLCGPEEVGITRSGRLALRVVPRCRSGTTAAPIEPGDVVVISGGARGITSEVAVALAEAFGPKLVLLGRSPEPALEPDWLVGLHGEAEIKEALARRGNGSASLKLVARQYQEVAAARQVRRTLERIERAGATCIYRQVDVRDAEAVALALASIAEDLGPVRGLVHGAGVLADARIEDKTDEQFDRVWGTKVGGLRNLLAALDRDLLKALVLFSSSSGRFGRVGQADYAAANEALNKIARREAQRLPGCRVLSINWGPWDGGMVSSGLKKLFAEEGTGIIAPGDGASWLVRELASADAAIEVVVLATPTASPAASSPSGLPAALPLAFERAVDVESHPVLGSHRIDGRPVVPMALLLEWLAHAAVHHNPGLVFHGCDELRVLKGVVVPPGEPVVVRVGAGRAVRRDGLLVAPAEVRGQRDGREVLYARADVVLANAFAPAPSPGAAPQLDTYTRSVDEVYRSLLFHGPALEGIEAIKELGAAGISARVRHAPAPSAWLARPLRQQWLADPLVLDASFQLMALWGLEERGAGSLPCYVRRYRQYSRSFPPEGARVVVNITQSAPWRAVADMEYLDHAGQVIARLDGYECTLGPELARAFGLPRASATTP